MNIIDIRPGHNESPEALRFSNEDWNGAVLAGEPGGSLEIYTQCEIDDEDGPAVTVCKADIPAFFAAIRKGIELGWFPQFEPAEKPAAKPAAKKK